MVNITYDCMGMEGQIPVDYSCIRINTVTSKIIGTLCHDVGTPITCKTEMGFFLRYDS